MGLLWKPFRKLHTRSSRPSFRITHSSPGSVFDNASISANALLKRNRTSQEFQGILFTLTHSGILPCPSLLNVLRLYEVGLIDCVGFAAIIVLNEKTKQNPLRRYKRR